MENIFFNFIKKSHLGLQKLKAVRNFSKISEQKF